MFIYEGNDSKDIELTKYNGKLATTYIDRESDVMETAEVNGTKSPNTQGPLDVFHILTCGAGL
uniref:Uncharacterized protein n=1 Tax=Salix viminalis TaxID=40686 RepID=A0A6N2MWI4_SALVM